MHCIPRLSGGGAERQLAYLSAEQAAAGHSVSIVCTNSESHPASLEPKGIHIHQLQLSHNYDPLLLLKLNRVMATERPDIVMTWILQMDIAAGIVASVRRIPWIMREPASALAWPRNIKSWMRTVVASRATAIVANSSQGAAYWSSMRARSPLRIIPNCVPFETIEQAEAVTGREIGLETGESLILYVGRLIDAQKNLRFMLEALERASRLAPLRIVLIGDGPDRQQLEHHGKQLGLAGRVHFLGHVDNPWSWMKRASAVILLSKFEGEPNVLLEAIACGCQIVASDIPEHQPLLSNSSAFLINPSDHGEAVAAILRASVPSPEDSTGTEQLKSRIKHRTPLNTAREYESLFRDALNLPVGPQLNADSAQAPMRDPRDG